MSIIEVIVDEISQFLNLSRDEVYRRVENEIFDPGINVARAWKQANPTTEEEFFNFYRTTDAYIFDLYIEHQRSYRKKMLERVLERLKRHNVKVVLDYGGGLGFDALAIQEICSNVVYFELRSLTSKFAEQKFKRSGHANIKVVYDTNELKRYNFDAIVCLEVLEHAPQPMEVIKLISQLLKDEGIVLLSEAFELVGDEYPAHLKMNQKYAGKIFSMMEKHGLVFTYRYPDNKPLEFKKIRKGALFIFLKIRRQWLELMTLMRKVIKRVVRII